MKLQQLYTSCLAQGAYYIESEGEAVVIDPLREVEPYLQRAEQDGAKIKYVLETHFHADFVSGHLDLAAATGAPVVFGPEAKPGFEAHIAKDGEVLRFGKLSLEVLHTPGHTPESTCYLLRDEEGQPHALFSGDTLFIGDVGRPDLAAGATATPEEMAATLYRSLRTKIMPLSDTVLVYPAHGAGSVLRPASITCAPASSACKYGCGPIMPTMRSARSTTASSSATALPSGLTRPARSFFFSQFLSTSELILTIIGAPKSAQNQQSLSKPGISVKRRLTLR